MDAAIAARKAKEAAEADRLDAIDVARRDREYKASHRLPPGVVIPEELEAARKVVDELPAGRLKDCFLQLQRGSALEVCNVFVQLASRRMRFDSRVMQLFVARVHPAALRAHLARNPV